LVEIFQSLEEGAASSSGVNCEAAGNNFLQKSGNFYPTTQCQILKDTILQVNKKYIRFIDALKLGI